MAGKEAKPGDADAGAGVEHPASRCRLDRSLEPHRVAAGAVSLLRLQHGDAAAEEIVEGRAPRLGAWTVSSCRW